MSNIYFFVWCSLLSALFLSSLINADYPSNGVNLEYCRTSEDCAGTRSCLYYLRDTPSYVNCTSDAERCYCRYITRTDCVSSKDCPVGERCFLFKHQDPKERGDFYWTCRMQFSEVDAYVDVDALTCEDVWLGGYTDDICHTHYYNCAGNRKCVQFLEDGTYDNCPLKTEPCFCWPQKLTTCSSSVDFEDQDRCATSKKGVTACFSCGRVEADDTFTIKDSDAVCSSPSPLTSPAPQISSYSGPQATNLPSPQAARTVSRDTPASETENPTCTPASSTGSFSTAPRSIPVSFPLIPPCISVVHYQNLRRKNLVFDQPIRAGVLCDSRESCATPGHMDVFRSRAMTMASYCAEYATCLRRTAWVNNPRMRQALRVVSHTEGLHFSALSARYETKIEEYFLKLVNSFGI